MKRSSRSRVKGVAIFIVFLAVAITLYKAQDSKIRTSSMDFKPSANVYRDLKFINKAKIDFSSDNVSRAKESISQIMAKYGKQQIHKQNEGNYGAYLFTISQDKLYTVVGELEAIGTLGPQVEQIDTALVNLDFVNESEKLKSYENELLELNKIRQPVSIQNDRKEALHSLIQASRSNLDKLRNSENVLLYLTLSPKQTSTGWLSLVKSLIKSFLKWLVFLIIAAVLINYATKLLMYLLSALGVRGPSGIGGTNYGGYSGYGGYSNYSKYSSRYGNSKRKVKRIYKDKSSSSDQDTEGDGNKK